jgi:hypothetical protein
MKRPFAVWLLIIFLVFLALGGVYGGMAMLLDPSGGLLQMSDVLTLLHLPNYILPGLFLIFVMGLAPLIMTYGLLARPRWPRIDRWTEWSGHHWSWTGSLIIGVILLFWLGIQGMLIGFRWPIQYVTAVNGLLIILFALIPKVRRFYSIQQ